MTAKHNGNHSATEFHPPKTSHRWHVLGAVEIGNFLVYMDGFVVTLALPWMMCEFGVPVTTVKWVVIAYLLPLTVMLLTAGRIADMVGLRRPVTLAGMTFLTIGSGLCFMAPSFGTLIAFRVVQGLGGALVLCTVLLFFLKSQPTHVIEKRNGSFDWAGSVFSILGIGALFMGFDRLGENLDSSLGYVLIPAGLILMIVFVLMERSVRTPLLDLSLFRSRVFVFGSSAAGIYFIAAVACYFMMPFYLQVAMEHSPLEAGILMVPVSLALAGSALAAQLLHRGLTQAGLLENLGGSLDPSALAGHLSAYTHAQTTAFRVAAVIVAVGILVSMLRGRGNRKPGDP